NWTTSATLDPTEYYTFTLTPAAGFSVTVTGLTAGVGSNGAGPDTATLRSSLDGFTSDLATGMVIRGGQSADVFPLGSAFQNLTLPIELRVYGFTSAGAGGQMALTSDAGLPGLVANGSVQPLPEPSALALAGVTMAAFACAAYRRRRRGASASDTPRT